MYELPVQIAITVELLLLVAGSFLFENKKKYFILTVILGLLFSTPWFVRLALSEETNFTDGLRYVVCSFCSAFFAQILFAYAARFKHWKILSCILLTLLLFPSGTCFTFYITNHAVFNVDAVIAIWQTNFKELVEYIISYTNLTNFTLLFTSLAVIYFLFLRTAGNRIKLKNKKTALLLVLLIAINGLMYDAAVTNSISMVYHNAFKIVKEYRTFKHTKQQRKENPAVAGLLKNVSSTAKNCNKGIYVLVIGESHNRDYMSAYGYPRENTPWLTQLNKNGECLLFTHAFSCHTQTIPALSYALTAKNQYNTTKLSDALSLLEIAKAAGYETVWLSNQVKYGMWDTPVSVIAAEADQQVWLNECTGNTTITSVYDGELAKTLDTIKLKDNMLIIIHLMGSHINYDQRYPKEYNRFGTHTDEAAYCNSVLYTDNVLKNIYEKTAALPHFKAMVYFSDHASVPKDKLDHDSARFVSSMTHIPMFICLSEEYTKQNHGKTERLKTARDLCFTNDLIFNLMLSLMGIELPQIYEKQNDILSPAYNAKQERFRTSHGERKIKVSEQ